MLLLRNMPLSYLAQLWHSVFFKYCGVWPDRPPPKGKVARSNRAGVTNAYLADLRGSQ